MAVDFNRIVDAEAKNIADNQRYYIASFARRSMEAREFVQDIALAIAASPLAERTGWYNNDGQFNWNWYTYQHDGGYVEYTLKRDEGIRIIAPIIKWMTEHGWSYVATPNADSQRVVYHLKRDNSLGNVVVRLGESKSCHIVEVGEEVVPSRIVKKYAIECDDLEKLPYPDGDEQQSRIGFVDDNNPF
jgi:hypothetical protein